MHRLRWALCTKSGYSCCADVERLGNGATEGERERPSGRTSEKRENVREREKERERERKREREREKETDARDARGRRGHVQKFGV